MKLIIDIHKKDYQSILNSGQVPYGVVCAIMNGTPLPKGQSILAIDTPKTCADCPCCIYTAEEKRAIGFCNTSNEDYFCKLLKRFMEYDKVDGGIDILGKPSDCPLKTDKEG